MRKNSLIILCGICWGITGARAEITETMLPNLNGGTVGVETGLSADIFGSDPDVAQIIEQIKRCGEADFDSEEKQILKRILMTDVGGVAAFEKEEKAFLIARLNALMQQGMFGETLTLLDKIPEKNLTTELKQIRAEALFASGRIEEACSDKTVEAFENEAFIRAVCAEAVGKTQESALAFDVYRESGRDGYAFFDAAGDTLYRGLTGPMPEGRPNIWEVPIFARVFGEAVFDYDLDKKQLWTLINQERTLPEVRERARQKLETEKYETGDILEDLMALARLRRRLKPVINPDQKVGVYRVPSH